MQCGVLYYTYQIDEIDRICYVNVYGDEQHEEFIDSFTLEGNYDEGTFDNLAYEYICDNYYHTKDSEISE